MSDNKDKKLNLKIMKNKVKISIDGTQFLIPADSVSYDTYNNNEPYIYMRAKLVASIIKQYVKKHYPELVVSATSETYSGGSSVRVNVCNKNGSQVEPLIYENIKQWEYKLKAGSFDGMYDIYNYREDSPTTDSGTPLKYFPSYIFIENKPNWGSKEYWMNEWNEWVNLTQKIDPTDDEKNWISKVNEKGGWLSWNKEFMSKTVLNKIDDIINMSMSV